MDEGQRSFSERKPVGSPPSRSNTNDWMNIPQKERERAYARHLGSSFGLEEIQSAPRKHRDRIDKKRISPPLAPRGRDGNFLERYEKPEQGLVGTSRGSKAKKSEDAPKAEITGVKRNLVLVSIYFVIFLFSLNSTMIANIQPSIINTFGETQKLPWISIAFTLAAASTNLLWGRISSLFNVKKTFIVSFVIFEVGSALCGAAQSMDMLIIGRIIAGLGCQGSYNGVTTFIHIPTKRKAFFITLVGLSWGFGIILGPVIGAAFDTSSATWRWAFYINLVVGAVFAPVYIILLPSFQVAGRATIKDRLRHIDFVGGSLLLLGLPLLIIGITFGGVQFPWSSATVIGCLVAAGIVFILLGVQQGFSFLVSKHLRILPLHLFRTHEMWILCAQAFAAGASVLVPIYLIPLYLQTVKGESSLEAAGDILPFVVSVVVSCISSGVLVLRFKTYMFWFLISATLIEAGAAVMYTVDASTPMARFYGASTLLGFGAGLSMQLPFSIAQQKVEQDQGFSVNRVITLAELTGLTLMLALANTVFFNLAIQGLAQVLPQLSLDQVKALLSGTSGDALSGLTLEQSSAVVSTIAGAMRNVYMITLGLGCVMLTSAIFLQGSRLDVKWNLKNKDKGKGKMVESGDDRV